MYAENPLEKWETIRVEVVITGCCGRRLSPTKAGRRARSTQGEFSRGTVGSIVTEGLI
jgi:hypothetical protein